MEVADKLFYTDIFHDDLSFVFRASSQSFICVTSSVANKEEEEKKISLEEAHNGFQHSPALVLSWVATTIMISNRKFPIFA